VRLLLVTHFYPDHRGGIELVAGHLARRLAAFGWAVTWAGSGVTPGAGTEGISLLPMRTWNGAEDRLGVPYPIWSAGSLARLAAAVRVADVVHLHDALYFGNAAAYRLSRRYRKPVAVTQHIGDVPYNSPLLRGLLWAANRTVARHLLGGADQTIFIAPRVRDYFARFVPFRAPPRFIPNGVDTARFRPPADAAERAAGRAALGWPADRPVLLFVGRFVEKKGLHVLRGAAERLPDCDFVFAGWGPIDPSSWGRPNVRLAGSLPSERLAELFRAADLLVLPSVGEGFPLVVQEAMACGTPAIISRETSAGYPGAPGWAVAVDPTPDAVASAVRATLADPDGLARRRAAVAAVARAEWDWDQCAATYSELFRTLAGGPRRPSDPHRH
jgi:glycosyltransferase involved in cell wall biosynthesis